MISTNDVRPGMALNLPAGLFQVVEYQHVKPGKGKAFVRMKLKNVETGAVVDKTFPLSRVPDAMRYLVEGRVRGKVVITV